MKKTKKYFLLTYVFISICVLIFAQNPKEDFIKINEFYSKNTKISMQVDYAVYLDQSPVAYETETGVYKKDNNKFYVKEMDCEIIRNEKYVAVASHDDKIIMLDKKPQADVVNIFNVNLDSLLKLYKEVKYFSPDNSSALKAYSMVFAQGEFESVDVIFDAARYNVKRLIINYREPVEEEGKEHKVKMVISYSNIDLNPKFPSSLFWESNFVQMIKGDFILQPKYKEYEFINHLKNNG